MSVHEEHLRDELRRALWLYVRAQGSPLLRAIAVHRLRGLLERAP